MFHSIFIEEEIKNHPKVLAIAQKYFHLPHIFCEKYTEVFNPAAQNFRLQKKAPSLILAAKKKSYILPIPKEYGLGCDNHFYFSHMLNCLFDCKYCFLQGMYNSANYVFFINLEDFEKEIAQTIANFKNQTLLFFSGYDCDSLALESVTGFASHFIPFFEKYSQAFIEFRTKSIAIQPFLQRQALNNCIIAFSLSPTSIANALELKAPSTQKRLEAIKQLGQLGWPIGLRFDPLIYCNDFENIYGDFFSTVFQQVSEKWIHSVTLGPFRLPKALFKKMQSLNPEEKLFAHSLQIRENSVSYLETIEKQMISFCKEKLFQYLPAHKIFSCHVP